MRIMDLAEILQAIQELSKDQQTVLGAWIADRDEAEWDAEIARDFSQGGNGAAVLDEMRADVLAGKSRPFEQGRPRKQ